MPEMMHAVGHRKPVPISDPASLEDAEVPIPEPGPRDLLVQVKAVSSTLSMSSSGRRATRAAS